MTILETDAQRDAKREIIRQSFDDIVGEIGQELREAGLGDIPIFLNVVSSGLSLVGIGSALDVSDEKWNRTVDVACQVIGKRLGINLSNRDLLCAAVNAAMSATELASD